jgi:hypothetical protein
MPPPTVNHLDSLSDLLVEEGLAEVGAGQLDHVTDDVRGCDHDSRVRIRQEWPQVCPSARPARAPTSIKTDIILKRAVWRVIVRLL